MDGQAGGVRQQSTQRNLLRFREPVLGHFPRFQLLIDVFVDDSFPCSTRCNPPVAATGLLMEPAWNRVFVVTGSSETISATP